MSDEREDNSNLFELTNDFVLGNYQSVINNSESVTASSDRCVWRRCLPTSARVDIAQSRQKTLIKFYVYRAMVAQGA